MSGTVSRGSRALLGSVLLGLCCALAAPVLGAPCIGAPNVVELSGVVDRSDAGAVGEVRLVAGGRTIAFAVLNARRLGGLPADAVQILERLGPGIPKIQVVGTSELLAPLLAAKPGETVVLRGVLDDANRYLQLLDAKELPAPSPAVES